MTSRDYYNQTIERLAGRFKKGFIVVFLVGFTAPWQDLIGLFWVAPVVVASGIGGFLYLHYLNNREIACPQCGYRFETNVFLNMNKRPQFPEEINYCPGCARSVDEHHPEGIPRTGL